MKLSVNILVFFTLVFVISCKNSLELKLGQKVNPGAYSLNTGTSFWWCNESNLNKCVESSMDFMAPVIRFPGGLDANIYHMDGSGYGIRIKPDKSIDIQKSVEKEERKGNQSLEKNGNSNDQTLNRSKDNTLRESNDKISTEKDIYEDSEDKMLSFDKDESNQRSQKGKKWAKDPRDLAYPGGKNIIGNVIKFCKSSGTKMLFTCNMNDATYEENKDVLDTLIKSGVDVVGIELGNEFYLRIYQDSKYPSVSHYVDTARYYTERLRKDFPGLKIGIIAAPLKVIASNQKRVKYYDEWNKGIAKEDFYDAFIVHHYSKNENCACDDFSDDGQRTDSFNCHHTAMQEELISWFSEGLKTYKALFPDKKMWLTEWSTTMLHKCYGNTQVGNLYYAAYQNEVSYRHNDFIEIATHHNWLGNGIHYPIITLNKKGEFERRSSSHIFSLLKPIYQGRETYTVDMPEVVLSNLPATVKSYAYYQPGTDSITSNIFLVLVNFGNTPSVFKLPESSAVLEGKVFNLNSGTYSSVYADELFASTGVPGFGKTSVSDIKFNNGETKGEIKLEKYSVVLVSFKN